MPPKLIVRIGHVANRKQALLSLRGVFTSRAKAEQAPSIEGEQSSYYEVDVDSDSIDIPLSRYDPSMGGRLTINTMAGLQRDVHNAAPSNGEEHLAEQDHDES